MNCPNHPSGTAHPKYSEELETRISTISVNREVAFMEFLFQEDPLSVSSQPAGQEPANAAMPCQKRILNIIY